LQRSSHSVKTFLKLEQQLAPATWVCFASLREQRDLHLDMIEIVSPPIGLVEELAERQKIARAYRRCYRRRHG
jgi:hypothetical protein